MDALPNPFDFRGFKVISLQTRGNPILGDITIEFSSKQENKNEIYTTVLIGPNGTGKSYILSFLVSILNDLSRYLNSESVTNPTEGGYLITFTSNGPGPRTTLYQFSNDPYMVDHSRRWYFNRGYRLFADGVPIHNKWRTFILPSKVTAVATQLSDRFPLKLSGGSLPYQYLGIRSERNPTNSKSEVRRTVETIALYPNHTPVFRNGLKKLASLLGFKESVGVTYAAFKRDIFFNGNLKPDDFKEYFEKIGKKSEAKRQVTPRNVNHFESLRRRDIFNYRIEKICSFCNRVASEKLERNANTSRWLSYDITNDQDFDRFREDFESLDHLRLLGILSSPEIELDNGNAITLNQISSGEYFFFSKFVGMMAASVPRGLVLIDEPENSLHPNWQMRYMEFLREIFENTEFGASHFIIATHSHFMVSDLKGGNSTIVGLTKTANRIEASNVPRNLKTYGWSAEEVLYRVFNVRSMRNAYFEYDLNDVIYLINNGSRDYQKIRNILNKLETIVLGEADPLNIIIEKARNYISENA